MWACAPLAHFQWCEVFYIRCPLLVLMGNWVFAMMCITFITNILMDSVGGTGKFFHSKSVYTYS